jgi:hypothetical protein
VKRQANKPSSIAHTGTQHRDLYNMFQKCLQWLKVWMCSQWSKCFWKRYNSAWPFWGEPSSDQAVLNEAMWVVREISLHLLWSLQYRGWVVKSVKKEKGNHQLQLNVDKIIYEHWLHHVASISTHITGKLHNNIMWLNTHHIQLECYESRFAKLRLKLIIKCHVNNCLKLILLLKTVY